MTHGIELAHSFDRGNTHKVYGESPEPSVFEPIFQPPAPTKVLGSRITVRSGRQTAGPWLPDSKIDGTPTGHRVPCYPCRTADGCVVGWARQGQTHLQRRRELVVPMVVAYRDGVARNLL